MTALATAFVEILPDTSKLGPELQRDASSAGTSAGKTFSSRFAGALKLGAALTGAFAVTQGSKFLKESIGEASALGESLNAVNVTFGKNAAGIKALGRDAADAVGLSRNEFNGLAVQFSSFATTIAGKGGNVVGTMDELTTRGADFASVMNLEVNEAMSLFQSGLAGESEPLRKFGIDLSAAAVEAHAYKTGIAEAGATLTENQKVQARYALLMKATAKTQGDFTNTSDSLANSQRRLGANIDNLQAKVGAKLIPVLERASAWVLNNGIPAFDRLFDAINGKGAGADMSGLSASFATIGASLREAGPALATASKDLPSLTDALSVGSTTIAFFADNAHLLAKALPFLAVGFVAVKAAQAAANTAALISVPVRIAEVVAMRAQTAALKQLAATQGFAAIAQNATTTATTVGTASTLRQTVATVAATVAQRAAAAAAKVWAAGQWLLNAALSANPIGLVIAAVGALVVGLVIAYKKSETFRNIVTGAFNAVKRVAVVAFNAVKSIAGSVFSSISSLWSKMKANLSNPIQAATSLVLGYFRSMFDGARKAAQMIVDAVRSIPGRIKALGGMFADAGRSIISQFVNGLKNAGGIISGIAGNVWDALRGLLNGAISRINSSLEFTISVAGKGFNINPPDIPMLAKGTNFFSGGMAIVGEKGPELVTLPRGSRVTPNDVLARRGGGSAAVGAGVTINVDTINTTDPDKAAYALRRETSKALTLARL